MIAQARQIFTFFFLTLSVVIRKLVLPLFITLCVFGDCQPVCVYNSPARIETSPANVYTELSFNYWQTSQDNMELGLFNDGRISNTFTSGGTITSITSTDSTHYLDMDFGFNPGFTIAVGWNFNYDDWDLRAEYTWFHNINKHRVNSPNFLLYHSASPSISPTWGTFFPASIADPAYIDSFIIENYQTASESWRVNLDTLDLDIGRWFYVGRKIVLRPSFGIRGALIDQDVHISYINGFASFPLNIIGLTQSFLTDDKSINGKSRSWGTGLKMALDTEWILGKGFRLYGSGEVDTLFTRYTALREITQIAGSVQYSVLLSSFSFPLHDTTTGLQKNINCLRTHVDLTLGINWGMYINQLYLDTSLGYEFQVFFDQNMFRHDVNNPANFLPNGNLYIQGLTAAVKLDF